MPTPYLGFSEDKLLAEPTLQPGEEIECPVCKGRHVAKASLTSNLSELAPLFYECSGKTFLAGLLGHSVMNLRPELHAMAERRDEIIAVIEEPPLVSEARQRLLNVMEFREGRPVWDARDREAVLVLFEEIFRLKEYILTSAVRATRQ